MIELPIGAVLAGISNGARMAMSLRPGKVGLHRKSSDEHSVSFWVVHKPLYPGQPLWAEVSIVGGSKDRVTILWPDNQLSLPWGISGNADKCCFSPLYSSTFVEEAIKQGQVRYQFSDKPSEDRLIRSKWGLTDHGRACFKVSLPNKGRWFGDWVKIRIRDTSTRTHALKFIRSKSI